jgi:hypothetical protein
MVALATNVQQFALTQFQARNVRPGRLTRRNRGSQLSAARQVLGELARQFPDSDVVTGLVFEQHEREMLPVRTKR